MNSFRLLSAQTYYRPNFTEGKAVAGYENEKKIDKQETYPSVGEDIHTHLHAAGYDQKAWQQGAGTKEGKLPEGFGGLHISGTDHQGMAQGEGFSKEAPYQHDGIKGLWNGIKHLVGANDTVEDKVKEGVYKSLPKQEQEAIDKERAQQKAEMTQMTLVDGDHRSYAEKYPHLAKFDEAVKREEDAISNQVLSGMSQEDRTRLKQQEAAYYKQAEHFNPYGTGEGMRPRPEPGHMLQEYWQRVAEATDKRYSGA